MTAPQPERTPTTEPAGLAEDGARLRETFTELLRVRFGTLTAADAPAVSFRLPPGDHDPAP